MFLQFNLMNLYKFNMTIVEKFKRLLLIEKTRYKKKGIKNILIAVGLMVGIMWSAVAIGSRVWPQQIEDKPHFVFMGSFIIHTLFQFISLAIYLPGYLGLSFYYPEYVVNKKSTKPWERKDWPEVRTKTIYNLLINQFIVYPLFIYASSKGPLRVHFNQFPSVLELFTQVMAIYFLEDFFFYWGHRMFHTYKALYKMHKIHHEYDNLYSLVTEYFHPVDFILANVLPSALGVVIVGSRVHCFTLFFWIGWKVLISTEGHSGYEFPWMPMRIIPLVIGPSYHDHHHSHNVGNYAGSCYFWDLMLDTNKDYMNDFLKTS